MSLDVGVDNEKEQQALAEIKSMLKEHEGALEGAMQFASEGEDESKLLLRYCILVPFRESHPCSGLILYHLWIQIPAGEGVQRQEGLQNVGRRCGLEG